MIAQRGVEWRAGLQASLGVGCPHWRSRLTCELPGNPCCYWLAGHFTSRGPEPERNARMLKVVRRLLFLRRDDVRRRVALQLRRDVGFARLQPRWSFGVGRLRWTHRFICPECTLGFRRGQGLSARGARFAAARGSLVLARRIALQQVGLIPCVRVVHGFAILRAAQAGVRGHCRSGRDEAACKEEDASGQEDEAAGLHRTDHDRGHVSYCVMQVFHDSHL